MARLLTACTVVLTASLFTAATSAAEETSRYSYVGYLDGGYAHSNRKPSDNGWASKSSTATLNEPELFLAMANIGKNATTDSRWGFEFGLQTGADADGLVTAPPPAANEPLSNADDLKHFYRANVSYLWGDDTVKTTFGLINSYIGYESYLAIDNPNYTRAYLSDTVPYFLFGLETMWTVNEQVDLGFYLINGYNYLTDPNDLPSAGFLGGFQLTDNLRFTQNLYYGSDQKETDLEFWRFFTNSILEWKKGKWLIAGSLDYGREKQADLAGEPTHQWSTGALWVQWQTNDRLSFAFRPEFHIDDDGLATGGSQRLQAYTGTAEYELDWGRNRFTTMLELRYDKTNGNAGFPDAPNDTLRSDKMLIILGLLYEFAN